MHNMWLVSYPFLLSSVVWFSSSMKRGPVQDSNRHSVNYQTFKFHRRRPLCQDTSKRIKKTWLSFCKSLKSNFWNVCCVCLNAALTYGQRFEGNGGGGIDSDIGGLNNSSNIESAVLSTHTMQLDRTTISPVKKCQQYLETFLDTIEFHRRGINNKNTRICTLKSHY